MSEQKSGDRKFKHGRQSFHASVRKLGAKQQTYVKALAEGHSRNEAKALAGYSEATPSTNIEKQQDVAHCLKLLIRNRCPPERLARVVEEGLSATKSEFFTHQGVVTDQRDTVAWAERRAYVELAAKLGDMDPQDAPSIQVAVVIAPEHTRYVEQAIDCESLVEGEN